MNVRVYHAGLHFGEEPFVRGNDRAGMVNFAGCHLACSHCYTPEAASGQMGEDFDASGFLARLERLVAEGAKNLNFISPTVPWVNVEPVLRTFRERHPEVPVVLKTSGYEGAAFVRRMAALADVLVPDFKVLSPEAAVAVGLPAAYGTVATEALRTLMATHGQNEFDAEGRLQRGIVLRYLCMPGFDREGERIVDRLVALRYGGALNVMTRFVRPGRSGLVRAAAETVRALLRRAEGAGFAVAVDGVWPVRKEKLDAVGE